MRASFAHPGSLARIVLAGVVSCCSIAFAAQPVRPAAAVADTPDAQAARLLEVFQTESNITNSLGMLLIHVPNGYRVGQYEVTQSEYQEIMGENPSRFVAPRRPVEQVSWNQARQFCQLLTQKDQKEGKIPPGYAYALPAPSQWEHYVNEARLEDAITSHLGDRRSSEPVGSLPPNKYGLYDTRGNVWEWCSTPVARGASWRNHEDYLAINFTFVGDPSLTYDDIGFRVILQASGPAQ